MHARSVRFRLRRIITKLQSVDINIQNITLNKKKLNSMQIFSSEQDAQTPKYTARIELIKCFCTLNLINFCCQFLENYYNFNESLISKLKHDTHMKAI